MVVVIVFKAAMASSGLLIMLVTLAESGASCRKTLTVTLLASAAVCGGVVATTGGLPVVVLGALLVVDSTLGCSVVCSGLAEVAAWLALGVALVAEAGDSCTSTTTGLFFGDSSTRATTTGLNSLASSSG